MAAIRSKGNRSTELRLVQLLRSQKLNGWRRHRPVHGRPDFVWPTQRLAVFVDGCFWHGCSRCYQSPMNNKLYWANKVKRNRARDRQVTLALRKAGWRVIRIWECDIGQPRAIARLRRAWETPRR